MKISNATLCLHEQRVWCRGQVPLPDVRGRAEILEMYLKDKPVKADVDIMRLARATPGAPPKHVID